MTSQEKFSCELCVKTFDLRGRLNQHLKTHSKPLKCKTCPKGFALRADLKRHVQQRHSVGNLRYKCWIEDCVFSATRKDNLTQHVKSHTSDTIDSVRTSVSSTQQGKDTMISRDMLVQSKPAWTLLMDSAKYGNIGMVMTMLDSGSDLDTTADDGSTALHCAARAGQTAIVQLLMDRGASLNPCNLRRRTPLMEAALGGHPDCILSLLRNGAITGKLERGRSSKQPGVLFVDCIVRLGNVELVQAVLAEEFPQLGYSHDSKLRAFALAAARLGQTPILEYMLRSYPEVFEDLKKSESFEFTTKHEVRKVLGPLWSAVWNGHITAANLLLTPAITYAGPNVAALSSCVLDVAAGKGFVDICKLILDCIAGHQFDTADRFQEALNSAALRGHTSVIKTMLAHDNTPLSPSNLHDMSILSAFWGGHYDTAYYLLQYKERKGHLHMMSAGPSSLEELIRSMLRITKLKINNINFGSNTFPWRIRNLLYIAVERGDLGSVKLVLEHEDFDSSSIDASFQCPGNHWYNPRRTALDTAQTLGYNDIADFLIAHGAINHHVEPRKLSQLSENPPLPLSSNPDSDVHMHDTDNPDFDFYLDSHSDSDDEG